MAWRLRCFSIAARFADPIVWLPPYQFARDTQAAAQGRSIRELILLGVRVTLVESKRPRSRRVKFPLIVSDGPKVDLTSEQIYEHLEFP